MILRHAVDSDRAELTSFEVGDTALPWLDEVAEIVAGLIDWRDDPAAVDEGREVIVAEEDDQIIGVTAHTAFVTDDGRVWPAHRYLMVTAVRHDHQRCGVAQLLLDSLVSELAQRDVRSVEWLVHPSNTASMLFSRQSFPEAQEYGRPEDKPYVLFVLEL